MQASTFDDFDEYTATIRDANLEMLLQTLVYPRWTICQVEVGGIHIQHGRQGSGDITQGQAGPDGVIIYVPLANATGQRANGKSLDANSVVIFEPGAEFTLSSNIDHEWCTVFFPNDQLDEELEFADRRRCRTAKLSRRISRRYRILLRQILAAVEICDAAASSPALDPVLRCLDELSRQLIGAPPDSQSTPVGRPALPRDEIVRRATGLLESQRTEPLCIGDIAAACAVSERTLRSAFQEYYGAAPLRHFQLRRLHQIRRALVAADPNAVTVGEVLLEHGEWEFGRFAGRYRSTFGEFPSETLHAGQD